MRNAIAIDTRIAHATPSVHVNGNKLDLFGQYVMSGVRDVAACARRIIDITLIRCAAFADCVHIVFGESF